MPDGEANPAIGSGLLCVRSFREPKAERERRVQAAPKSRYSPFLARRGLKQVTRSKHLRLFRRFGYCPFRACCGDRRHRCWLAWRAVKAGGFSWEVGS